MKIAIIADIHENFHNLILALKEIERQSVSQIICLGDLMNSGIAKLLAAQSIPVFMIWGNNDGEKVEITLASKRANSQLTVGLKTYSFLELGTKKIFISHYEELAVPMALSGLYDAVFYGHTHLTKIEKINGCWVVNPGEIAASKTKKATFAIYDTLENQVEIIELSNSISLKTPLMEAYFKENGEKMGLRSKAFSSMDIKNSVIPASSPVFQTLQKAANSAKILVFSGLPGVGKSLYINQFQLIAAALGRKITVIQWDIARKAFETPEISARYPMGKGVVHNGLKLCAGKWLIATIVNWLSENKDPEQLLLIEAPLVGHRFIEIAKIQANEKLEAFFKSPAFQVLVPIPSKKVREKIEADRRAQISEDAKTWVGAKPSVMLMLWKMICGIANEFGRNISMDGQPPYNPEVYEFVFGKILKHRHFVPLHIDEIFSVNIENEADLHNTGSLAADIETANLFGARVAAEFGNDAVLDEVVDKWYLT